MAIGRGIGPIAACVALSLSLVQPALSQKYDGRQDFSIEEANEIAAGEFEFTDKTLYFIKMAFRTRDPSYLTEVATAQCQESQGFQKLKKFVKRGYKLDFSLREEVCRKPFLVDDSSERLVVVFRRDREWNTWLVSDAFLTGSRDRLHPYGLPPLAVDSNFEDFVKKMNQLDNSLLGVAPYGRVGPSFMRNRSLSLTSESELLVTDVPIYNRREIEDVWFFKLKNHPMGHRDEARYRSGWLLVETGSQRTLQTQRSSVFQDFLLGREDQILAQLDGEDDIAVANLWGKGEVGTAIARPRLLDEYGAGNPEAWPEDDTAHAEDERDEAVTAEPYPDPEEEAIIADERPDNAEEPIVAEPQPDEREEVMAEPQPDEEDVVNVDQELEDEDDAVDIEQQPEYEDDEVTGSSPLDDEDDSVIGSVEPDPSTSSSSGQESLGADVGEIVGIAFYDHRERTPRYVRLSFTFHGSVAPIDSALRGINDFVDGRTETLRFAEPWRFSQMDEGQIRKYNCDFLVPGVLDDVLEVSLKGERRKFYGHRTARTETAWYIDLFYKSKGNR